MEIKPTTAIVYTANTRQGSNLICLRVLSSMGTNYGERWKACVTAGVCELMLLTLGNEEQTRTKRTEGGADGGRGESKREGSSEDRDEDSCSTVEAKNTHKANGG